MEGRLTDTDLKALKTSSGSDLELQPQVLLRIAENYKSKVDSDVMAHNLQAGAFAESARRVGMDPTAFTSRIITPESIGQISSSTGPVTGQPQAAPPPPPLPPTNAVPSHQPRRRYSVDGSLVNG
jgi:hypothetical protein